MDALLLMLICGGGYLIAYHTYGRFLAKKIFKLDKNAPVPSVQLADGIDYVPTRRGIIFGHHYTSIAGTGPIVGPAIGIIWGWLPAILWVLLGAIFMGAVHDFAVLIVSMRNQGKSVSEIAARYINPRARFIFFSIVFLSLLIVIAIFCVVIGSVFSWFPESVLPVWLQIPIAITLGWAIYKKTTNVTISTILAVVAMYLTVSIGAYIQSIKPGLFTLPDLPSIPATGLWTIILLIYAWFASSLPVTVLLQPRDYINAWQLFIAMSLLAAGIIVASFSGALSLVAPAINSNVPADAPPIWPFMFVIIACGAISGFHCLVASGTSPKQVASEPDSLFVGYGSMLMEGMLATLVIICVAAGIGLAYKSADGQILTGFDAWNHHYASWAGAKGLGTKLAVFVTGAANIIHTLNLPYLAGTAIMGVFVASFAGTTLDTAVRIQRYIIGELALAVRIPYLSNRWVATTFAVLTAAALAFATGADGKGAMKLWPLFGTSNQLLAALALLVITIYLRPKGSWRFLVTGLPCLIMLTITNWAMVKNEIIFFNEKNWLLVTIGTGILALALWMTIEAIVVFIPSQRSSH